MALIFLHRVPLFWLLWPAVDAVCFETFGFAGGLFRKLADIAVEAFGFKNEKSVPCFGFRLPLVLVDGKSCFSLADGSAVTTQSGTKWFGTYQLPRRLSKFPSLDHRICMASSLGSKGNSDGLGLISLFIRQRYRNSTDGYIETIGLDRTEAILMIWTREDHFPTSMPQELLLSRPLPCCLFLKICGHLSLLEQQQTEHLDIVLG